jgi:hypothetical protein
MDKEYRVLQKDGSEKIILAGSPGQALGIFLKRGRFGIGAGWLFTRQPTGWIVASNKDHRTLERTYYKMREVEYVLGMQ